jgi:DNA gyrase subunit B
MLSNQEIRLLVQALGTGLSRRDTEIDLSRLRYQKVVIMTDADVDGAHIRTLLLTFFYRQMKEIIKRGYLYIAQPPLYKYKKHKTEHYLKDDIELEKFLLENSMKDADILDGNGKKLEPSIVKNMLTCVERKNKIMSLLSRRRSSIVLSFLASSSELNAEIFYKKDSFERFIEKIKNHILKFGHVSVKIEFDSEHNRYYSFFDLQISGKPFRFKLDFEFVNSAEFDELKKLVLQLDTTFILPLQYSHEKKSRLIRSWTELRDFLLADGKSGAYIQRYKGLGEMNPQQLWETTMQPSTRQFLQVTIEDAMAAEDIFSMLMGDAVPPRKEFIELNALNVKNLDV